MSDYKKIILAAAAGVVLGLLFAPEKGSEIRKRILREGEKLADDLKEKAGSCKGKCTHTNETMS